MPTERPILFSGPMVRALIDGRKTQTRRVVKPVLNPDRDWPGGWMYGVDGPGTARKIDADYPDTEADMIPCPYGQPGDRLYVRECFHLTVTGIPIYRADYPANAEARGLDNIPAESDVRWSPSIHMPRWASRIDLEVTDIRVERVQEISTEDIVAEGLSTSLREYDAEVDLRDQWVKLWDSLNAARGYSWESNPWVWVVEFEVIK